MIATLWTMVRTEVRMIARQRLSAALVLVLPLVTMPGAMMASEVYLGTLEVATSTSSAEGQMALPVAVHGSAQVERWVAAAPGLALVQADALAPPGSLRSTDAQAIADVQDRRVTVLFHANITRSRLAAKRLEEAIRDGVASRRQAALEAVGLPGRPEDVVPVAVQDHADGRGENKLGAVLPLLVQITLVMVALYTALDIVSGEKERKTGETLLTAAVDRRLVTIAKTLVTTGTAALSGLVGVGSVVLLIASGAFDLPRVLGGSGAQILTAGSLAVMVAVTVLLAVQTSGVATVLAAWVPDYRTGSMLSAPLAFLIILPAAVAMAPGVEGSLLLWILPIGNLAIACRDLLAGTLTSVGLAVVLSSSAVHAALSVAVATHLLGRQASLVGEGDAAGRRALGHTGKEAFFLFTTCAVLLWFFGQLAQKSDPVWGMVFTQVALMAAPAIAMLVWLGLPLRETLGLRRLPPRDLALGLVAGASMFGVGQGVWRLQDPLVPTPDAVLETFRALELPDAPGWVPLLVFAVLPAVCEEVLFRGALLSLLPRTMRPTARVIVVALAFGAMHLLFSRILPTAALGVLLGFAVVRTGSLWVAVVMHAVHNGLLIALARNVGPFPALDTPLVLIGAASLAIAAVAGMGRGATSPEPGLDLHDGQIKTQADDPQPGL